MLKLASLNRWQAAGSHLALSAIIGATVLAAMIFVWYPPPYFEAAGGNDLVLLMLGVDVALGPLLTLAVFNPRKGMGKLRFDLAVIAFFQLAALAYGVHVMFIARPSYLVFAVDRFDLVMANTLPDAGAREGVAAVRPAPDRQAADRRRARPRRSEAQGGVAVPGARRRRSDAAAALLRSLRRHREGSRGARAAAQGAARAESRSAGPHRRDRPRLGPRGGRSGVPRGEGPEPRLRGDRRPVHRRDRRQGHAQALVALASRCKASGSRS